MHFIYCSRVVAIIHEPKCTPTSMFFSTVRALTLIKKIYVLTLVVGKPTMGFNFNFYK